MLKVRQSACFSFFPLRKMVKCFLAGSAPGLSWASGICWYAGRTEGIYPQCQSRSGMLVCTPVDCNEPWTLSTKEQRRMGPHGRGRAREAAQQNVYIIIIISQGKFYSIITYTCRKYFIIHMSCTKNCNFHIKISMSVMFTLTLTLEEHWPPIF